MVQYARELRCADTYVEAVFQVLERAGRMHDTTVLITADHGEGFMQSHTTDVGHGGAIYDTQSHVPFLVVGPGARELPDGTLCIIEVQSPTHGPRLTVISRDDIDSPLRMVSMMGSEGNLDWPICMAIDTDALFVGGHFGLARYSLTADGTLGEQTPYLLPREDGDTRACESIALCGGSLLYHLDGEFIIHRVDPKGLDARASPERLQPRSACLL